MTYGQATVIRRAVRRGVPMLLGVSEGTVGASLNAARTRLRGLLQEEVRA
jgi:hypothetical protein